MLIKKLYFDSIKLAGMQDHRRKKHYLFFWFIIHTAGETVTIYRRGKQEV
jgi:hypothetical protein